MNLSPDGHVIEIRTADNNQTVIITYNLLSISETTPRRRQPLRFPFPNSRIHRMSAYRRTLLALAVLPIALPLSARATSLEACLADLNNTPPAKVAQSYAARLKTEKLSRDAAFWSNYCIGRAWKNAGELKRAEPALRAAVRLAKNPNEHASAQSFLGSVLSKMGHLDAAETAHKAELAAAEEMRNDGARASAHNNLAGIAENRKQYGRALDFYTLSLVMQPDENEKAVVLSNIAGIHRIHGDATQAIKALQESIAIARRLNNQIVLARSLINLGYNYCSLQQWKNCDTALSEGLQLARDNGDRYWEATALAYYGRGFRTDRKWSQAHEFYTAALKIYRAIGAASDVAQIEAVLRDLK